jgi:hypothetical protein
MEDAPPHVDDLVQAARRFVKNALGVELDGTPDTLPLLDHWLDDAHGGDADVLALVAPAAGAYFGEVVRATLAGARWHAPGNDHAHWRIEFDPCFLSFNPIGAALEAVHAKDEPGWSAHFRMSQADAAAIAEILERTAPPVDDDDYYRLTTRYEVLEQVHARLVARALEAGEPAHFGPDAYAALDGELIPGGAIH